jgi:hypothetical protein
MPLVLPRSRTATSPEASPALASFGITETLSSLKLDWPVLSVQMARTV